MFLLFNCNELAVGKFAWRACVALLETNKRCIGELKKFYAYSVIDRA